MGFWGFGVHSADVTAAPGQAAAAAPTIPAATAAATAPTAAPAPAAAASAAPTAAAAPAAEAAPAAAASAAAAAAMSAATTTPGKLYPGRKCPEGFLVEEMEGRQADVREFFVVERVGLIGISDLKRGRIHQHHGRRSAGRRSQGRSRDSKHLDGFTRWFDLRDVLRLRHSKVPPPLPPLPLRCLNMRHDHDPSIAAKKFSA